MSQKSGHSLLHSGVTKGGRGVQFPGRRGSPVTMGAPNYCGGRRKELWSRLGSVCRSRTKAMQSNKNILNSLVAVIHTNKRDSDGSGDKVVHTGTPERRKMTGALPPALSKGRKRGEDTFAISVSWVISWFTSIWNKFIAAIRATKKFSTVSFL